MVVAGKAATDGAQLMASLRNCLLLAAPNDVPIMRPAAESEPCLIKSRLEFFTEFCFKKVSQ